MNKVKDILINLPEQQQDPFRFTIIALFSIPTLTNAILWISTSPIASQIEQSYDISTWEVSLCSSIFMIVYLVVNFPANYILDTHGIRPGIVIGSVFTAAGAVVRIFIQDNFLFVLLGQTLGAIGQPFLLNAPAKIANDWFIPSKRPLATAILSIMNFVGVGIGFVIPGLFVSNDEDQRDNIRNLMYAEAIIIAPINLLTIIFMRNKPKYTPSSAASIEKFNFYDSLGRIMRDKDYLFIMFSFSLVLGVFNALATLVERIIQPFGYSNMDSSVIGALLIIMGILGAIFLGLYVEHNLKFKQVISLCIFIGAIVMAMFYVSLWLEFRFGIVCVLMGFAGFVLVPVMPLSFELAVELCFPVGEAIVAGMLVTGGQAVGIIIITIFTFTGLDTPEQSYYVIITCIGCLLIGFLLMIPVKQNLKRNEHERLKTEVSSPQDNQTFNY